MLIDLDKIIENSIWECLHSYNCGETRLNPLPRTIENGYDGLTLEPIDKIIYWDWTPEKARQCEHSSEEEINKIMIKYNMI